MYIIIIIIIIIITTTTTIIIIIIILITMYLALYVLIGEIEQILLRIPTGWRLTSWLFTQRCRGVELGATKDKSR